MERVPVELTGRLAATAWRLAGARVRVVTAANGSAAFEEACASAPLVLVDEAIAALLPRNRLAQARRATRPLVLIVPAPERTGRDERVPDVIHVVRHALGVAT